MRISEGQTHGHPAAEGSAAIEVQRGRLRNRSSGSLAAGNNQRGHVGSDEEYARQTLQLALEESERSAPECIVQGNIEIV